jgi:hypothetical protein
MKKRLVWLLIMCVMLNSYFKSTIITKDKISPKAPVVVKKTNKPTTNTAHKKK